MSSLVGQTQSLLDYLQNFRDLIMQTTEQAKVQKLSKFFKNFMDQLNNVLKGLNGCGYKIISATKFIDFFVHDILDYTVLSKDGTNFIKNWGIFDIRTAIGEIIDIKKDQTDLKNIVIKTEFKAFGEEEHAFLVKTDQKRLQ